MKKLTQKIVCLGTCAALTAGCCLPAFADSDGPVTKDENVFLFLNPDGSIQQQLVSDWLHSDTGLQDVTDCTSLTGITNLKSDAAYTLDGSALRWDTGEHDVYYQGESSLTPPVTAEILYELNGQPITAEELLGKSGHVRITVDLTNHIYTHQMIGGVQRKIYTPFATVVSFALDADDFTNLKAEHGSIQTDSQTQIAAFVALPGLQESFQGLLTGDLSDLGDKLLDRVSIEADTDCFVFPTIIMAASTSTEELLEKDEDFPSLDEALNEMRDGFDELKDGSIELDDGAHELDDGAQELDDGAHELDDGAHELDDGAKELDDGAKDLDDGAQELKDGAFDLDDGAGKLKDGAAALDGGLGTLLASSDPLIQGVNALSDGSKSLNSGLDALLRSLSTDENQNVYSSLMSLSAAQRDLTAGMQGYFAASKAYLDSLQNAQNAVNDLLADNGDALYQMTYDVVYDTASAGNDSIAAYNDNLSASKAKVQEDLRAKLNEKGFTPEEIDEIVDLVDSISGDGGEQAVPFADPAAYAEEKADEARTTVSAIGDPAVTPETLSETQENLLTASDTIQAGLSGLCAQFKPGNPPTPETKDEELTVYQAVFKLKAGAEQLDAGINGEKGLANGASALLGGVGALKDGSSQLAAGTADLKGGTEKLKDGTRELKDGTKELRDGTKELRDGTKELVDGTADLVDGTQKLVDGTRDLVDGTQELLDGVDEFRDKLEEKAADVDTRQIDDALDTLDAVQAQAKTYTSYTGTPDGVDATIKFVMKVEAPEVPETEALEPTAAVQTEKPSFWQRLKALFGWG